MYFGIFEKESHPMRYLQMFLNEMEKDLLSADEVGGEEYFVRERPEEFSKLYQLLGTGKKNWDNSIKPILTHAPCSTRIFTTSSSPL